MTDRSDPSNPLHGPFQEGTPCPECGARSWSCYAQPHADGCSIGDRIDRQTAGAREAERRRQAAIEADPEIRQLREERRRRDAADNARREVVDLCASPADAIAIFDACGVEWNTTDVAEIIRVRDAAKMSTC